MTQAPVRPATSTRWTPILWAGTGLTWLAALIATGSAAGDVALWVAGIGLGVLLPGVALVRAVRPNGAPLIEDLGWGIPAGFLIAVLGWAVGAALPWAPPPWLFGPLVVAVLFAVPGVRARLLARPEPGWGLRPNLVLCGALLVVVCVMTVDFLRLTPADPGASGSIYYPDSVFQLAVAGQLRHALFLTYPTVAGEPYAYHWLGHTVLAHLLNGGVEPLDAVVRLTPATLLPAMILTAAVVARGVARRVTAGPLAAVLIGVLGTTVATQTSDGRSLAMVQTYWWASITTVFGWIASLAVAGCAVAFLRGERGVPTRLFVPFLIFAVGAKSSVGPVLLGGVGLALVAAVVTRQRVKAAIGIAAATAAVLGVAALTEYAGGNGLHLEIFGGLRRMAARLFPALTVPANGPELTLPGVPATAVAVAAVLFFLPLLPRLVGLVFLPRRDPATWFFVGVLVAGVGGILVFRHPGESELFFLISAYPLAAVASAWGLSERTWRWVGALAGAAFAAVVAAVIAFTLPDDWAPSFRHALAPLGLLALVLAVAAAATWRLARPWFAAATIGAILGTGLLSTAFYATSAVTTYSQIAVNSPGNLRITRDDLAGGRWLAEHAGPDDILASNRVCVQDQHTGLPNPCQAKAFTLAAVAGRTVEVGGWAYASRSNNTAWSAPQHWTDQPFWDPPRLARELTAFSAPTPQLLADLHRDGVRWLVAEATGTPPDTAALDRLATRRLSLPGFTVWQLTAPA